MTKISSNKLTAQANYLVKKIGALHLSKIDNPKQKFRAGNRASSDIATYSSYIGVHISVREIKHGSRDLAPTDWLS